MLTALLSMAAAPLMCVGFGCLVYIGIYRTREAVMQSVAIVSMIGALLLAVFVLSGVVRWPAVPDRSMTLSRVADGVYREEGSTLRIETQDCRADGMLTATFSAERQTLTFPTIDVTCRVTGTRFSSPD